MKASHILCAVIMLGAFGNAPVYAKPPGLKNEQTILGGRPPGCPYRFCGCAMSLRIFGSIKPRLNLSSNWRSFPRTQPASGMVAVRSGHVFQLIRHVEGNTWVVWDPNNGGGKTRIHHRSLAGYSVVDPHGSSVAAR